MIDKNRNCGLLIYENNWSLSCSHWFKKMVGYLVESVEMMSSWSSWNSNQDIELFSFAWFEVQTDWCRTECVSTENKSKVHASIVFCSLKVPVSRRQIFWGGLEHLTPHMKKPYLSHIEDNSTLFLLLLIALHESPGSEAQMANTIVQFSSNKKYHQTTESQIKTWMVKIISVFDLKKDSAVKMSWDSRAFDYFSKSLHDQHTKYISTGS